MFLHRCLPLRVSRFDSMTTKMRHVNSASISPLSYHSAVPIVDMSLPLDELGSQIHSACSTVGFFIIINHGVSENLCYNMLEQGRRLFRDLSEEDKESINIKHSNSYRGYQSIGVNVTKGARDGHEALDIISESKRANRHIRQQQQPTLTNYGENQWPNPNRMPEFRPTVEQYVGEMNRVGRKLMQGAARGLDMNSDFFAPYFNDPYWSMRVIRYPLTTDKDDTATDSSGQCNHGNRDQYEYGVGEHTDYGVFTMILCDPYPETLQIRKLKKVEKEEQRQRNEEKQGNASHSAATITTRPKDNTNINDDDMWINVDPIPGGFICNLGDMMARWSNNIYVSTPHRVLRPQKSRPTKYNNGGPTQNGRISVPFFFDPNYDSIISPIEELIKKSENPPCFEPIMYGDHLLNKMRNNFKY